jgi:hypothetical protein
MNLLLLNGFLTTPLPDIADDSVCTSKRENLLRNEIVVQEGGG